MERKRQFKLILLIAFPIWVTLLAVIGYYLGKYDLWEQFHNLLGF